MGIEASPGPGYSCTMWTAESGGGDGFGLGLFGQCSLLYEPPLVFCSTAAAIIIQYSTLMDKVSPGRSVFCVIFPSFQVNMALL